MNLVDCYVKELLGRPFFKYEFWWVAVSYDVEMREASTALMFKTFEEAKAVKKGYKFSN